MNKIDKDKLQRIGILGGTFDPIHKAHLSMGLDSIVLFKLDFVLFLPSAQSPLKKSSPVASNEHRKRMIELAIEDHPQLELFDWELEQDGVSYSINTIHELKRRYSNAQLFWILGVDQAEQLSQWKSIDEMARSIEFIVFPRDNVTSPHFSSIPHLKCHCAMFCDLLGMAVSSTEVRDQIKRHQSIEDKVPQKVESYIKEHRLYL